MNAVTYYECEDLFVVVKGTCFVESVDVCVFITESSTFDKAVIVCVFITAVPIRKLFAR